MTRYEYTMLGLVLFFALLTWAGSVYIKYVRRKKHNTELWGTIFEGVTNKLIDLDAAKQPEVLIEKKTKRAAGQGKGDEESNNPPH